MKSIILVCFLIITMSLAVSASGPVHGGKVANLPNIPESLKDLTMYSGTIDVNATYHGSMFYWLIESQAGPDAPVILWLQGGPGFSSLTGLFNENGPFVVNDDLTLNARDSSWISKYTVLYIDQPCGAGYSTVDKAGLVTTSLEAAQELHTALKFFFEEYTQYKGLPFFIFGESYAGKFIPMTAHEILFTKPDPKTINLKGIGIGNGFSDPVNQANEFSAFAYQTGLIDQNQRSQIETMEKQCVNLINKGEFGLASDVWNNVTLSIMIWAGWVSPADIRTWVFPNFDLTSRYLNQSIVAESLHVPGRIFIDDSQDVGAALKNDIMQSVAYVFPPILEQIPVILFNGMFDFTVPNAAAEAFTEKLAWPGQACFNAADRVVWQVDKQTAGFVKSCQGLTQVIVTQAGHMAAADQTARCLDMIDKFVHGQPFIYR